MARTAVLVDLSFFLMRYRALKLYPGAQITPHAAANAVWTAARAHLDKGDSLYRILVYDCPPLKKVAHNPLTKKAIDFSRTETFKFPTHLHQQLICKRKVALRLGELGSEGHWVIRERPTKALLSGKIMFCDIKEADVEYAVRQKGVDIKLGIDLASIAYKRLADRVVLMTGDSDFVPAAKLARREGIDVVLDPLWAPVSPSLNEHIDGLKTTWPKPQALIVIC